MAVYTHVNAEEIESFIAEYNVGEVLSFKGIAEGVENSNYLLRTTESQYILTLYEKRVNADDLPFFLGLMEHLAIKNVNCATPIEDKLGNTLKELCGRPAALIGFLDGLSVMRPDPNQCGQLGAAMAEMHIAAEDFKLTRDNDLSLNGWASLSERCADRADECYNGLADIIENEMQYLTEHWPDHLPKGIIHADLFPDNVFFLDGELSGLIDYYFACSDILAYDIAISINSWCFEKDGAFNVTKASNLIAGYNKVRPLSADEINALPTLCRGGALRFMLTRLYDWLNQVEGALVKTKDPLEYMKILKFHQKVKSARDYGADINL